jgi:hypothetical protein
MVKFRIGFTIEAETLFGYISKLMPSLQDLNVEEIYDAPQMAKPKMSVVAQKVAEHIKLEKPIQPRKKHRTPFKHPSGRTLKELVKEFMEKNKGDMTWADLGKHTESLGYEKSSINNAITRLTESGDIEKRGPGVYGIKKK